MKVEQQPAYVLHARPFSETSLLVDVFTRDHGRLMLMARGARGAVGGGGRGRGRARSRARGVLLPFKPLLASWSGKGQVPTLTAVEQRAPAAEMKGHSLASGFYLNELLLRLLHRHDSHETLFEGYQFAVGQLVDGHSPHRVLRVFEKKLLEHIGFGAVLDHDAETGEAIAAHRRYHYVLEKGPVCAESSAAPPGAPALTVSGGALCALREEHFPSDDALRDARRLTRALIEHQLNGRALRSRRVIMEMRKYANPGTAPGGPPDGAPDQLKDEGNTE